MIKASRKQAEKHQTKQRSCKTVRYLPPKKWFSIHLLKICLLGPVPICEIGRYAWKYATLTSNLVDSDVGGKQHTILVKQLGLSKLEHRFPIFGKSDI